MRRRIGIGIAVATLCAAALSGQVITGTISGTVTDAEGTELPGVTVTVKNLDMGETHSRVTDASGYYALRALSLGAYEVRAELDDHQTQVRSGITLTVGRKAVVNFSMAIGSFEEVLMVTGDALPVNTTSSTISYLVEGTTMRELPLNGRDLVQLSLLQPGVVQSRGSTNSANTGRGTKISVAGARPDQNLFTLDGTDLNDALNNTPGSAQGLLTGVETVKEFQVLTNTMSAEYGRVVGGVFNVVTKSGTNRFHGSVFEFHRNDSLDTRNFFDVEIPEFERNQFGFVLGGPLVRDKTHFFVGYEGFRETKGITQVASVPDDNARMGILPGEDPITISPAIQQLLDLYPRTNGANLGDGVAEFRGVFNRESEQDFLMARIDHQISPRDSMFLRYLYDDSVIDQPVDFPNFPNIVTNTKHIVTLEETHIFSTSVLNEARFGFNSSKPTEDVSPADPRLDLLFVEGASSIGQVQISGLTEIGTDRTNPKEFFQELFQIQDNVFITKGRHDLKVGFVIDFFRFDGDSQSRTRGRLQFRSLKRFLEEDIRRFEVALPGSDFQRTYEQELYGIYLQDDFRVLSNLTLNLGVRWEKVTEPDEKNGKISNLRSINDPGVIVGAPLFKTQGSIAPRFGFAWDPWRDGKTAIRGGWGRFYEQPLFFQYRNPIFRSLPFAVRSSLSPEVVTFPFDLSEAEASGTPTTGAIEFDPDRTYTDHWNLTFQRDIGWSTVVQVSYMGSRGKNLYGQGDLNTAIPEIQPNGTEFFPEESERRNPNFDTVRTILQGFESEYTGITLGVLRRLSRGLRFQVAYTHGDSKDNRSGSGGRQQFRNGAARTFDPYNINLDWGRSDFDIEDSLNINASYDLPYNGESRFLEGWRINLIGTYQSGVPLTPIIDGDPDRDQSDDNNARPNVVRGGCPGPRTAEQWFDPAAFSFPEPGTRGNAKRNSCEGPDLKSVDLSIVKTTDLGKDLTLQFRVEVFNLFNEINLDIPSNTPDGAAVFDEDGKVFSDAGKIFRTATDARQVQLGIKLIF